MLRRTTRIERYLCMDHLRQEPLNYSGMQFVNLQAV